MNEATTVLCCPVCGKPARERVEQARVVVNPATGRDLNWVRLVAVFRHDDAEHTIFAGRLFFPPR
jgi:hypothetical protein